MLSRLALRKALDLKSCLPAVGSLTTTRGSASSPVGVKEGPERDTVNFPRPLRPEYPSPCRHAFIPESWFQFLYPKTGVTGPYVFMGGMTTYLLSKEIWVMEHDFGYVFAFFGIVYLGVTKYGKQVAAALDKQVDETEAEFKEGRLLRLDGYKQGINDEKKEQWRADGQELLITAKRDNVKMQLEATYRARLMEAYNEVKKRLDYQVEKDRIERVMAQKHMVQWVVTNVLKSISGEQEKDALKKCIAELKTLSARA